MKISGSVKRLQMNKAQSRILVIIGLATIVTVFCLMSTKSLLSQASYHRKELSAKRSALKQINANIDGANKLGSQYQLFDSSNPNVIGGKNSSDPNTILPDGNNGRIVLDALPSQYDFPALISSATKILTLNQITNTVISGTDLSNSIDSSAAAKPQPVSIPLTFTGVGSYGSIQNLIKDFERSIRPFDTTSLQIRGSADNMSVSIDLTTYFQPAKTLSTGTKEVR